MPADKAAKVGIYAGTFDPVHAGHLTLAGRAADVCGLDKVFFMAEPRPRRKQGVKALEHRREMIRLAIAEESRFGQIMLEQTRFSVDKTLPVLTERFSGARLFLLMGDDVLRHLAAWPNVEKLISTVTLAIGLRGSDERMSADEIDRRLQVLAEATSLRPDYELFDVGAAGVSSSLIRRQLRRGEAASGVPLAVLEYIEANKLYAPSASSK